MILNRGEFGGVRLLSRKTVELMTTPQLDEMEVGFGFGIELNESTLRQLGSAVTYNGGGFFYTNFFIDPQEQMIGVFMGQLHPSGGLDLAGRIRILIYQAIAD